MLCLFVYWSPDLNLNYYSEIIFVEWIYLFWQQIVNFYYQLPESINRSSHPNHSPDNASFLKTPFCQHFKNQKQIVTQIQPDQLYFEIMSLQTHSMVKICK